MKFGNFLFPESLSPLPHEAAAASLRLFMERVAPEFGSPPPA